jgi:hypothetical protein
MVDLPSTANGVTNSELKAKEWVLTISFPFEWNLK